MADELRIGLTGLLCKASAVLFMLPPQDDHRGKGETRVQRPHAHQGKQPVSQGCGLRRGWGHFGPLPDDGRKVLAARLGEAFGGNPGQGVDRLGGLLSVGARDPTYFQVLQ